MKRTVKTIITLLTLTMFLVYSSGLKITVHHCCHKHHHSANDHRHCSENTYIFKITDQYDSDQNVKKNIPLPQLLSNTEAFHEVSVIPHFHEICTAHCHCMFHAVHRCIFDVISQLIL
ncbi:MAG: hypothetical protein J6X16_00205 [Bacteroidales bacterium]|nr:hypothetical protein [Bacteroidales bacterium]